MTERFSPGQAGEIWYEHWHRYHFIQNLIRGKRILDVASGEGYGTAFLANYAASAIGLDLSVEATSTAKQRYGVKSGAHFVAGDCRELPIASASMDVVVSFETLEHIEHQVKFIAEIDRVLAVDGLLVLSTPNRPVYNADGVIKNSFHFEELDEGELRELLRQRFPSQRWFAQNVDFHSVIAPYAQGALDAQIVSTTQHGAAVADDEISTAKYFICICARCESSLGNVRQTLSLFADKCRFYSNDYRRLMAELEQAAGTQKALSARLHAAQQAVERLLMERNQALFAVAEFRLIND